MKKLLLIFTLFSCGTNGANEKIGSAALSPDTAHTGVVLTDTVATKGMNIDTTGMGNAR